MKSITIKKLIEDVRNKNLRLVVLGSGYVGLPTAALFAETGFKVIAVDPKPEVVKNINNGLSLVNEPGLSELVKRNVEAGRLRATQNTAEALSQADSVIISVQTPIDRNKKPNLSFLMKALEEVGKTMKKGMLVIISSTVPPGTMLEKVKPKLESLSGLKAEADFHLAYVPERMAPGKALKEFVESPRLVGGVGPNSTKIATELFKTVCKTVIETDAATAEIAKLAENTYRDINIAFANQLALICEQHGVDVKEVIKLANTHPRVNIHTPGPGVGGPCLPKDPYLLICGIKPSTGDIVRVARRINDSMPKHIVKLVVEALKAAGKSVERSRIAVLGTAYKGNVGDSRLSPAEPIIGELLSLGAKVVVYDPYCPETFGAKRAANVKHAAEGSDCIVVVTDHSEFKSIDLNELRSFMRDNPVIVDGRRIFEPEKAREAGLRYYGLASVKSGARKNK